LNDKREALIEGTVNRLNADVSKNEFIRVVVRNY
jgi:hypothetical protein